MTPVTACGTRDHLYSVACPCRDLLDVISNKWATLIIGALSDGAVRFGVLRRRLQGISPKVLASTLRRLEDFGLVDRVVVPAVPLHVEYSLTPMGETALEPIRALREWAESRSTHRPAG